MTSIRTSATLFSSNTVRYTLPARSRISRSTVVRATSENVNPQKMAATVTSLTAFACLLPQMANAAQEIAVLAEGEPLIVQAGWAALAASFTMSIAIVVWGRSGL